MVHGLNNFKKPTRSKSFHFRYLELCRSKNFPTKAEIKTKNNENQNLDFFGDKFKIDDWLLINEALLTDQVLVHIGIRLRKNFGSVAEKVDSEKKARAYKTRPVIFTNFVFMGFIEGISNCISINKNLTTLALEGLPLADKYVHLIANALSSNENIQSISFARSSIGDKGCEILCDIIKCLPNIEKVNMSHCQLSIDGASHITDMIKFQKIYRFSEGWKQSLRYREVDPDSLQGLRKVIISQNPEIGDEGVQLITEVLKEDVWIKVLDMEDCGITDIGGRFILECLLINQSIVEFNIRGNSEISDPILRSINVQLGKSDSQDEDDELQQPNKRISISKLRDKLYLLEEQLARDKALRKQVDILNEQLHEQLRAYEQKYAKDLKSKVPEGFVLVEQDAWNKLVSERDDLSSTLKTLRAHYKRCKLKKAKSEIAQKFIRSRSHKFSKSEHRILDINKNPKNERIYIETGIGDTKVTNPPHYYEYECGELFDDKISSKKSSIRHYPSRENFNAMEGFKIFIKEKANSVRTNDEIDKIQTTAKSDFDQIRSSARALFMGC